MAATITGGAAKVATDAVAAATGTGNAAGVSAVSGASQVAHTGLALVMDGIEYFITVPMVYLSVAFLLVAIAAKLVRSFRAGPPPFQLALYPVPRHPLIASLRDTFGMPQILKIEPLFWFFLVMYHVGFLLLILGHLDILSGINLVPPESRHMLGAGAVGVMVTLPTFYFLGRRFRDANRVISTPGDYLLLLLLLFLFLFGDLMSWGNSWTASGFVMTKADFARYFDGLASFSFADPRTVLHGAHYHFVVIHVLLANLLFITLPFTKVVHAFFSLPLNLVRRQPWKES
jgi:nitrate reductase gamma subunit